MKFLTNAGATSFPTYMEPRLQFQRGKVEVQTYTFFNLGDRWGWVVNATPRPLYPRERDPVAVVQEAGWVPGAGLNGRGKSRPPLGLDPRTVQPVASRYTD